MMQRGLGMMRERTRNDTEGARNDEGADQEW